MSQGEHLTSQVNEIFAIKDNQEMRAKDAELALRWNRFVEGMDSSRAYIKSTGSFEEGRREIVEGLLYDARSGVYHHQDHGPINQVDLYINGFVAYKKEKDGKSYSREFIQASEERAIDIKSADCDIHVVRSQDGRNRAINIGLWVVEIHSAGTALGEYDQIYVPSDNLAYRQKKKNRPQRSLSRR